MKNDFKKLIKKFKGYTLAEVMVILIVMAGILLLVGRIAIGDRQKQYDAKFNKISTSISANITKDLIENTGTEYADYAVSEFGNRYFQSAVTNNLDKRNCEQDSCWGAIEVNDGEKVYNDFNTRDNWQFYELKDKTVMAVSSTGRKDIDGNFKTDIIIDVNGKKGPNVFGKDIRIYDYPDKKCNHMPGKPADCDKSYLTCEENKATCKWDKLCKTTTTTKINNYNSDLEAAVSNGRAERSVKTTPATPENECKETKEYTYSCLAQTPKQDTKRIHYEIAENPEINNACKYKYKEICKTTDNETYEEKYADKVKVKKTEPSLANNCEWGYYCEDIPNTYSEEISSKLKYNKPTLDNYCEDGGYICLSEFITYTTENEEYKDNNGVGYEHVSATPENGCEDKTTYYCKNTFGKDAVLAAKTDIVTETQATPENNCTYSYECKSSVDVNKNTLIGENERISVTIEEASPQNECKNIYKYSCIVTDYNEGKDENKASNEKYEEKVETATPSNMCINKYSYTCATDYIEDNIKNLFDENTTEEISITRNDENAEEITPETGKPEITISTYGCGYTYKFRCKNPNHIFMIDTDKGGYYCSCSATNRPNDDGHVTWTADDNCLWTAECTKENRTGSMPTVANDNSSTTTYTYKIKNGNSVTNKNNKKTTLVSCPCRNARISNDYIDTNSVYTASPKAPTQNPDTCEWTYYCKNENLNITGTGVQGDKLRCECGDENITEKNNSSYNEEKENLFIANPGKMSNGKVVNIQPTSSNNCTRTWKYNYTCKVLTDNETYNAIPEEIRNNSCGIGTNGLNSNNCASNTDKKYIMSFNNTYSADDDSCKYTYKNDEGKPVCNPNYKKDKYYNSTSVKAEQNPDTCEWEYSCVDGTDMNYVEMVGTGAENTTNAKLNCVCKTLNNNPSYDENKLRAIYGDKFSDYASESINGITAKTDACHYVYTCKTGSNNKSYNTSLNYINSNSKRVFIQLNEKDSEQKPCQYIYTCLTGENGNTTYYDKLHKYFDDNNLDFNQYVDETFTSIDAENDSDKCKYHYSCKHSTANKSYNDLSDEIKNNTCFDDDPANDDEKCNSTVGKTKKYKLDISSASNSNSNRCIYTLACNSHFAKTPDKYLKEQVSIRSTGTGNNGRNSINHTNDESKVTNDTITVDKGICDYTYIYSCPFINGNYSDKRTIKWNNETQQYECPCNNDDLHKDDIRWKHRNSDTESCSWECNSSFKCESFSLDGTKILKDGKDTGYSKDYVYYNKSGKLAWNYSDNQSVNEDNKIIIDNGACDCKYTYQCRQDGSNKSYDSGKIESNDYITTQNKLSDKTEPCKYNYYCKTGAENSTYYNYKNIKELADKDYDYIAENGFITQIPTVENGCAYLYCMGNTSGYDSVYHEYSTQENPRVIETFTTDKDHNCIYSYKCKSCASVSVGNKARKLLYTDECKVSNNCTTIYHYSDPIVLDLKGNGIKFTNINNGVMFDINGDGKQDKVAWTAEQKEFDDAFLAIDKNGDGQINNIKEMFSDTDGYENGLKQLEEYDENGDGVIDADDAIYSKLRLWADMNKNGVTDSGELKSLAEMGVTEISLSYNTKQSKDNINKKDEFGNDIGIEGSFKRVVTEIKDGVESTVEKIGKLVDVFFNAITDIVDSVVDFFTGAGQ